jgi:hypothetical protein
MSFFPKEYSIKHCYAICDNDSDGHKYLNALKENDKFDHKHLITYADIYNDTNITILESIYGSNELENFRRDSKDTPKKHEIKEIKEKHVNIFLKSKNFDKFVEKINV